MVLSENLPHFQSPHVCFPVEAEPREGPGLPVAVSPGPAEEGRRGAGFAFYLPVILHSRITTGT